MSHATRTMNSRGQELHDRLTRGATLSADERTTLEAWYAEQDREEMAILAASAPLEELARLRQQVEEALTALRSVEAENDALAAENARIQAENAALQQRLPLSAPQT